mmetsp:Transcript_11453/g.17490  ORF Transcript_11453/g.17490 Transcript_11453/m.17490 type:complete len:580 (+) Transcript_11453:78-1817(+)
MILSFKKFARASLILSARHVLISAFVTQKSFVTSTTTTAHMTATATTTAAPTDCAAINFEEHSKSYNDLLVRLREITHLNHASAVLNYDRQVFMPQSDRPQSSRGKQLAVLATIAHQKSTDPIIGKLIEEATADLNELLKTSSDNNEELLTAKRILELEKDAYTKSTCIPDELAARKASLEASANHEWVKARQSNDFASFAPALKDCFDTAKEMASLQRGDETEDVSLYSQMLDQFEMGMASSRIDELFDQVQSALVPFIAKIRASEDAPSLEALSGKFDIDAQKNACQKIVTAIGFDEGHGRIDVSVHPFTMSLSGADVRITSRFSDDEWYQGLMGTIHEGGHAMYEQNLGDSELSLDSALSMGVHESQSLFWERHIGKSKAFYEWAQPILVEAFNTDDNKFEYSAEELYAAVNAVDFNNLIRVEADELTYPLHVILRYNIERDVVAGKLDVNDIPARWNADMKSLLDIDVPDDTKGCLQDIHWSCLAIGYFPTYLLGSMMAAQLAHYCKVAIPDMDDKIKAGEFDEIRSWLTKRVHTHGKRYKSLDDLLLAEVGEELNPQYFLDYLKGKYVPLYKVE